MTARSFARLVFLFTALTFAAPTQAQDPAAGAIDFDRLFAENADQVEVLSEAHGSTRWQLTLPGDIIVWADGTEDARRYTSMDVGRTAAVGCLWETYQQVRQIALTCPDLLSPANTANLDRYRDRVGRFVAANTVPPVPGDAFMAYWDARLDPLPPDTCAAFDGPGGTNFIETLSGPAFTVTLDVVLETPRLPASNPCF